MLSHPLNALRPCLAGSLCMLLALAACTPGDPVGGSDPTDPDASSPEPNPQTDPSAVVFADDTVLTYELTVAPADWQRLQDNPLAEEYVPATLSFQGQQFGPIGLRYKGNYSLTVCFNGNQQICPKVSFKLKFNEYEPELRMLGLKRLNLHSMFNDESMLRDRLAYSLYRDIGVPAPRMAHARLVINGEYLGIYAAIEQIDGRFTRSRYPDGGEGNLYKEVWPIYSNLDPYQAALKTNEDENPRFDKMLRFAADLAAADDQSFESVLSSWVDVDTLMRLLAVDRAIGNWDGPVSSWYCFGECKNHNYYWYEETNRDRMWLIPWDMNDTFKPFLVDQIRSQGLPDWDEPEQSCGSVIILGGTPAQPPSCDDFIHRLGTVLRPRYVAAGRELVAGPLSAAAVQAKLDRWSAQLEPLVAADPNGPGIDTWRRERDNLARFADEMRQSFATALDR